MIHSHFPLQVNKDQHDSVYGIPAGSVRYLRLEPDRPNVNMTPSAIPPTPHLPGNNNNIYNQAFP